MYIAILKENYRRLVIITVCILQHNYTMVFCCIARAMRIYTPDYIYACTWLSMHMRIYSYYNDNPVIHVNICTSHMHAANEYFTKKKIVVN